MSVVVAVDGGGSRCRLAAFTGDGELLARVNVDAHASLSISPVAAWQSIDSGIRALRVKLGKPTGWTPDKLMLGLAGSLKENRREQLLEAMPRGVNFELVTDGHAQLLGATGGEAGICLAIGTGSVMHWQDESGETGMAGGWGYPVGDEGSGAWLGMKAIQHYIWHIDGRQRRSSLIEALSVRIGTSVAQVQQWSTESQSSVLAQLAPIVFEHAHLEDDLAQSIVEEAVMQCFQLLSLAPEHLPVYVVGGVGDQLRPLLAKSIGNRLFKAKGDALHGLWQISQQSR